MVDLSPKDIFDVLLKSLKVQADKYEEIVSQDGLTHEQRKDFDSEIKQMYDLFVTMTNTKVVYTVSELEQLKNQYENKIKVLQDTIDSIDITTVKGEKGEIGLTGASGKSVYEIAISKGFVGSETDFLFSLKGDKGDTGLTGSKGDKGDTGSQGIQGLKGDKGDTGLQGIQGEKGEKGDKGDTGSQGIQGLKGEKGDTGLQGIQGEKGDTGLQGIQGLKGDKGDTGLTGSKGDKGDTGSQGIQGLKGDKGDTGLQGIQGEKGDKGDTGSQGIQGLKGDKGDTGLQGIQGLQGVKGDKGDTGLSLSYGDLTIEQKQNLASFAPNSIGGVFPFSCAVDTVNQRYLKTNIKFDKCLFVEISSVNLSTGARAVHVACVGVFSTSGFVNSITNISGTTAILSCLVSIDGYLCFKVSTTSTAFQYFIRVNGQSFLVTKDELSTTPNWNGAVATPASYFV